MAKHGRNKKESSEIAQATRIETPQAGTITNWKLFFLRVVVIVAAGLWIFSPALHGTWLWDDDILVAKNALTHEPSGFWKGWYKLDGLGNYYPLEVDTEWVEWHLWHDDTFGYHLTSVLLHILSALLIWKLLSKIGLRLAWLGGLLFIVHPVTVESVAWISELKNTLSLPLFLLAMCSWIDYDERRKRCDYFLTLGFFLVAMLAKTTMVMFPIIILLYAWWKRSRVGWSDLKIGLPFFVISLGLGVISVCLQPHQINLEHESFGNSFFTRFICGGLAITFYFFKCLWPVGLLPIYPVWTINLSSPLQYLPWPILGGLIGWLWTKRTGWGRHALLGIGFFLLNLIVVVGFIMMNYTTMIWSLDHLVYIPMIGLIGLTVAAMEAVAKKLILPIRLIAAALAAIVMGLLALESHGYAGMFVSKQTLCTYTIQRNPEAWLAYNDLGLSLFQEGRAPEAIEQYKLALKINPDYAAGHNNLGFALNQLGQTPEAIEQYEQALRVDPNYVMAHNNLGNILGREGRVPEAIEQYEMALKVDPDHAETHANLGLLLLHTGQLAEAINHFEWALKSDPDYDEAQNNLGFALVREGRAFEAIEHFEAAIKINPDYVQAHDNLAGALFQAHRVAEAMEQYEISLKINPDDANAQSQLTRLQNLQQTAPATESSGK